MAHSFLVQSAKWDLSGHYKDRDSNAVLVEGTIAISWKRESWFKVETQLVSPQWESPIVARCKGHLDSLEKSYNYVLQHSILGNIEGEGHLGSDSIVQHYWVVGSTQRQLGFDTYYRLNETEYHLTSVFLENQNLKNMMEAKLKYLI